MLKKQQEDANAFLTLTASNLGRRTTFPFKNNAVDVVLSVALDVSWNCFQSRARDERERMLAYQQIESEPSLCHHCGVTLKFASKSRFQQFTPDRTVFDSDGKALPYENENQRTVRSCLFCQYWFRDSDESKRAEAIRILINAYDEVYANKVVDCFIRN